MTRNKIVDEMTLEYLKKFEVSLHQQEIRTDVEKLRQLLHSEFIEIGYSGKTYNFDSIVESLVSEASATDEVWSQDFNFVQFSPCIVQLIYHSARVDLEGHLSRHAIRTSIWVRELQQWKMKFHQATPVAAFER